VNAVIDTNVLVSGMISGAGAAGRIVDLLRSGRLTVVADDRLLGEYIDVLGRRRFARYFSPGDRGNMVDFLRHESYLVAGETVIRRLPHAGDASFLEAALAAGAPLVTFNKRHFPRRLCRACEVLSPEEFLRKYFGRR